MQLGLGMIRHPNFSFSRCIFGLWLARGHRALQSLLPKAEEDAEKQARLLLLLSTFNSAFTEYTLHRYREIINLFIYSFFSH